MMGHRENLKNGFEWDYLTRGGRRVHKARAGLVSRVKRLFNKRIRKHAKLLDRIAALSQDLDLD